MLHEVAAGGFSRDEIYALKLQSQKKIDDGN